MKTITQIFLITIMFCLFACKSNDQNKPVGADGWLKGDESKKLETVAKHLRGFDMAMVETGYRYQELYWSGKDVNWEYAAYQAGKIRTAIENGLERRPKRAESAQNFLNVALPQMDSAIASRDSLHFWQAFDALTANCVACHVLEEVSFIAVKIPDSR
jgi:hypothetical protein